MSLHTLTRSPRTRLRVAITCTLALLLLSLAGPAAATGIRPPFDRPNLPGISLARLIESGESITSRNGEVTFGNFDAVARGIALDRFRFYRVVRLEDGFRLLTPLVSLFGFDAALQLSYSVEAADGLLIEDVTLSFESAAFLGRAATTMDLLDESGDPIADLRVWDKGFFRDQKRRDFVELAGVVTGFDVEEVVRLRTGLIAATRAVNHRFGTAPIPEPGTAVLMGLGLAGLGLAGRRRS